MGTTNITVDWDDQITNGSVCVSAINECGSSPTACMEVTIDVLDVLAEINKTSYSIFPNPANELLQVIFAEHKPYEILLLDVLGRTASSFTSFKNAQIDVSELPGGIYWLGIKADGQNPSWKQVTILR